ncbi:MAG: hypothetical protein GX621_13805 [Pirellulaceae bacterium]|nr:hypothetical protein [Pirellulaceae bacterium]
MPGGSVALAQSWGQPSSVASQSSPRTVRPESDSTARRSDPRVADTSDDARHGAIQSIPFERLKPEARQKVANVLSSPTLFRRMPVHVTACDPDLYLFLVRHPDVLVGIWEELGVSDFRMAQTEPGIFRLADGTTATVTAELVYRDHETHIAYCEGEYRGPLLRKPVRGRSILILKTGYVRESDGQHYITSRLDTFTHIENATIDFLTRTFQPLVGKVADHNFLQTTAFVGSLSRTTETNHQGVQRLAARLHRVDPKVRREFATLAGEIGQKTTREASSQTPLGTPVAVREEWDEETVTR